jgi:solute carrier family 25 (mitochondrial carnitine/acylcarnitine transporter), member 20/29
VIVCPMEHVKCRLQVDSPVNRQYKGPIQTTKSIFHHFGFTRLYQGWVATVCREVPAFGLYFVTYDFLKDQANLFLSQRNADRVEKNATLSHAHTWLASAFAGGCAGSLTWGIVYPVDVIKSWIVSTMF